MSRVPRTECFLEPDRALPGGSEDTARSPTTSPASMSPPVSHASLVGATGFRRSPTFVPRRTACRSREIRVMRQMPLFVKQRRPLVAPLCVAAGSSGLRVRPGLVDPPLPLRAARGEGVEEQSAVYSSSGKIKGSWPARGRSSRRSPGPPPRASPGSRRRRSAPDSGARRCS